MTDKTENSRDASLFGMGGELFHKALSFIQGFMFDHDGKYPSVTALQVEFGIGYPRARRLLWGITRGGYVSSGENAQAVVNAGHDRMRKSEFVEVAADVEVADDASSGVELQSSRREDHLYDQVLAYVRGFRNANDGANPSVTRIQMEFGIGYPRARRLLWDIRRDGYLSHA